MTLSQCLTIGIWIIYLVNLMQFLGNLGPSESSVLKRLSVSGLKQVIWQTISDKGQGPHQLPWKKRVNSCSIFSTSLSQDLHKYWEGHLKEMLMGEQGGECLWESWIPSSKLLGIARFCMFKSRKGFQVFNFVFLLLFSQTLAWKKLENSPYILKKGSKLIPELYI